MTVYVDKYVDWMLDTPAKKRKWSGGGHLVGSDLAELHEFAAALGLKRAWYQGVRFPHYDLTANKRRIAVQMGAIEVRYCTLPDDVIRYDPAQ